jgi:uncharacterized repeat protein (TIGR02543 family)
MQTDSCGWWGVDDENGYNCWDSGPYVASDCDYQTSLNNSLAAFTPRSVAATKGVTWTWHNSRCGPSNSVYPTPANPNINCPNVSTVTIQFSAPVSNAILHIGNLGGLTRFPGSRKTAGFDKNFDMTLYSKWTLTSGQDITMLSGENTTNITLDNNTIRNKYIPQGVGARPGVGECAYNEQTCHNKNGNGSGSFLILGTYSTITFNIDLGFSLVNYGWSEPTTSALVDSWSNKSLIEGVTVQISFYKYQLSYNLGGGTGTTPSTVTGLDQGDTTTLANDTGFTKTGYTFAGWNCDNSIGAKAAGSTATQPAADVICTAQWTAVAATTTYQLSYNLGGGTGTTPSTVTGLDQGDTTTLANDTGFTKTGYTFAGWNCDNSIGAKAAGSTATQPAANVVCTAQWTAVAATTTYQLSYNLGGGTGTTPTTVTGLNQGATTTLANRTGFTKTGYEFAGWNCDNSIGAKAAGSTATQPAANVVCTARWTAVAAPSSLPDTGPRTDRSLEIVMWLLTAGCALQLLKPSARRRWY